jgi:hypothetical protein
MSAAQRINPNVNSSSFSQVLTVANKTVSDADGMRKISGFATALITCIGEILIEVPAGLKDFATRLENSNKVLSFFNFVSHVKWWFCEERKSWQHTVSMISFTALQALEAAQFLEKFNAIDLSAIAANIGHIPVLGLVSSLLCGTACGFSAWHDGRKISELNTEIRAKRDELLLAKKKLEDFRKGSNAPAIDREELIQISRIFQEKTKERLSEYATKKLEYRVSKIEVEIANYELEKSKSKISLVNNIANLALDILSIIGLCAGLGALSVTCWPMIALGLVVAGIGLYEFIYDKQHEKSALPEKDKLLISVETFIEVSKN